MKRTREQQKRIWATIGDIIKNRLAINGTEYDEGEWGQIFTAMVRHQKMVENPNQKGSYIILGCKESELTVEEASVMISLMDVFVSESSSKLDKENK